ncbi:MAG: hypothetical protein OEY80_12570, partial [Nitrospirota bacterium]|nr:hypothetical protein [Nitrospirota bacterium]
VVELAPAVVGRGGDPSEFRIEEQIDSRHKHAGMTKMDGNDQEGREGRRSGNARASMGVMNTDNSQGHIVPQAYWISEASWRFKKAASMKMTTKG